MRRLVPVVLCGLAAAVAIGAARPSQPSRIRIDRLYPLRAEEGVFAYARISPNGQTLAYASIMPDETRPQVPGRPQATRTTQTVVDLKSGTILFSEPGIDAYWSLDGERMIFLAMAARPGGVTIRHQQSGELVREAAPRELGDYFSWAVRDGRNLILTINSNYYYLDGDHAVLPAGRVVPCEGIGTGERPLISKDGRRITTFVKGAVVVRGLTDCDDTFDTGLQGAKADFSWDGRYIAFHVGKPASKAYDLAIVDLQRKTMRTLSLPGSSLFPSWTQDGRLCFRYDGDDYRGFMMASNVLSLPEQPLPAKAAQVPATLTWSDLFPETPPPASRLTLVMIWAAWSAHSPYALEHLQQASREFRARRLDVGVMTALELSSRRADVDRLRRGGGITLPEIPLAPSRLVFTEALNQIPTTLLFRDGVLVDRRLGAQSATELEAWVTATK
jgi:hypothetical protein